MHFASKIYSYIAISLLFTSGSLAQNSTPSNIVTPSSLPTFNDVAKFSNNDVIVILKKNIPLIKGQSGTLSRKKTLQKLTTNLKTHLKQTFSKEAFKIKNFKHLELLHIQAKGKSTQELMDYFRSDEMKPYVENVFKNSAIIPTGTNDTLYPKLWALENSGQKINTIGGTTDADIDAPEAWTKTKGEQNVIVAILDTGVDYTHSDLQDNMWNGEPKHGYDFAGDNDGNNDDDPMPDVPFNENGHYHGTHVAGVLGAVSDNSNGVAGVAQHISLMSLKVFRPNGIGYTSDVLEALEYVSERIDRGDNIVAINASYAGYEGSQDDPLNQAIKKLGEKGVLFCTSAGNEGKNIDETPSYPASYDAENIIVVGASDQNDKLADFSNYGTTHVDILAPGTNILSTYPDNTYAYMQGTSMATPYVAGTVALIASLYGNSTVQERKAIMLKSVDSKSYLSNSVKSSGRLNVNTTLINMQESKESPTTMVDETVEIALPIVPNGSSEQLWKEVQIGSNPIKFTTKEGIAVTLKPTKDQQLTVDITSSQKSSTLLLETPMSGLKIDNQGNSILSFQGKDVNLEINSKGEMRSNLPNLDEAILPKNAFPLGTNLKMNDQQMQFTLPLSNTIKF